MLKFRNFLFCLVMRSFNFVPFFFWPIIFRFECELIVVAFFYRWKKIVDSRGPNVEILRRKTK